MIEAIDWPLAVRRVINDLKTDFIWAPQFRYLLRTCSSELIEELKGDLQSGRFYPGVPLTIEVPKPFRILVGASIRRLGPNFSRPGSILPVKDRLFYQAIADQAAPLVEQSTDRARSFSHQLAAASHDAMFMSNRVCWSRMQQQMRRYTENRELRYVLRLDIADYLFYQSTYPY